jgi:acyl-CoA thioester hydrolase
VKKEELLMIAYERLVQYYETDKMGIVHHSNYIRYFEEARTYFMDKCGINYADMEALGFMLPVVDVYCKYKNGAAYGDVLSVETELTACNGITAEFGYVIRKNDGTICTEGSSKHCFVDMDFKPVKLQKRAPELYDKISALVKR